MCKCIRTVAFLWNIIFLAHHVSRLFPSQSGIPMLFPHSVLVRMPSPSLTAVMPRVMSYHALHSISSIAGRVNEAENVVEDVVVAAVRQELESLAVAHGSPLLLDQQRAADYDKDSAGLVAGLRVDGRDLVLDSLEREFLVDVC